MSKKRKPKPKRSAIEQQLLTELLASQTTRIGKKRSEVNGWTDMPLFDQSDKQGSLF